MDTKPADCDHAWPEVVSDVVLADTITKLKAVHAAKVVVCGSHGGLYAGYCAAKGRVRAVVLNDAGVGMASAGIGSLAYLDDLGIAAATADSMTCRVADARDMWAGGIISFVNEAAAAVGCRPGQPVPVAAGLLRHAQPSTHAVAAFEESRFVLSDEPGKLRVIGIDSGSLFRPEDVGQIVVTGSHAGVLGGKPDGLVPAGVFVAVYNDAGGAKEGSALARLAHLQDAGTAAATASHLTAQIGNARSTFETGVISALNARSEHLGGRIGMPVRDFVRLAQEAATAR